LSPIAIAPRPRQGATPGVASTNVLVPAGTSHALKPRINSPGPGTRSTPSSSHRERLGGFETRPRREHSRSRRCRCAVHSSLWRTTILRPRADVEAKDEAMTSAARGHSPKPHTILLASQDDILTRKETLRTPDEFREGPRGMMDVTVLWERSGCFCSTSP
jgi:hypothetical protein